MRRLQSKEMCKRGCEFCLDRRKHDFGEVVNGKPIKRYACIHDSGCPYHELDKYESYDDYLKHSNHEGIDSLLGSVFRLQRDL